MKNFSILSILLASLTIASCGFEPLYAKKSGQASIIEGSSFKIDKIDFGRPGQKLQYELEDLLNHGKSETKKYRLAVTLQKFKEGLGIQKDRYITRYNVRVIGLYDLYDIATGKKLFSGTSTMVGGFDAVDSQFGTYSLEENTTQVLMKELAKDIVLSVSTQLSDAKSIDQLAAEQAARDKQKKLEKESQE